MTPLTLQSIYNLLPAIYRIRDAELALKNGNLLDAADSAELNALQAKVSLSVAEQARLDELLALSQRGPLQSLISLFAEQVEVLQESLYQGYDDLFIETCAEWVVPYIGQLVGFPPLADFPGTPYSLRAAVADTVRTRRRRGTVSGLETIARDVSGWPAHVVEYFLELATTQFLNHLRPGNLSWTSVRGADNRLPGTPFTGAAHTVDVRRIANGRGKYNIPNMGVWLWRLAPFALDDSPAFRVDDHRFLFDPLGRDLQIFSIPYEVSAVTDRSSPANVPLPITRRMLANSLNPTLRARYQLGEYYGPSRSLYLDQTQLGSPSPEWPIQACDLSDILDGLGNVVGWAHAPADAIAIDPVLGRFVLPQPAPAGRLLARYTYGFADALGGGPYSRPFLRTADSLIQVPTDVPNLAAALTQAHTELTGGAKSCTILLTQNTYLVETPQIIIPENCSLEIRSADGIRPVLVLSGDLNIYGGSESTLAFNGLLIAGGCLALPADAGGITNLLNSLSLSHCTLAPCAVPAIEAAPTQPAAPRIWIEAQDVAVHLDHTITGSLRLHDSGTLTADTSLIDAGSPTEIAFADEDCTGPGAALTLTNCTLIGQVQTRRFSLASNCIFNALVPAGSAPFAFPVAAAQLQQGCVRFSYVPLGSRVPRPFRCYPVSAAEARFVPAFTSRRFGDAGYGQLAQTTGKPILEGADDGSEMGFFHDLHQPQRLSNLRAMLADNLRFGLETGIFFAS